jgi:hypothetical protein
MDHASATIMPAYIEQQVLLSGDRGKGRAQQRDQQKTVARSV